MRILRNTLLLALVGMLVLSCEKDFDTPPISNIPDGNVFTISELRQIYADSGAYTFNGAYTVFGSVTTDAISGNFYREFFMQDEEAAIKISTGNSGTPYIGDRVRVNLNGATINSDNGLLEVVLDEEAPNQVMIQSTQQFIQPVELCFFELNSTYQGQLITLNNVEFANAELDETYADAVGQQSQNITIYNCEGQSLLLRSSGYASFAGTQVAQGNGSITGILSQYNSDLQLLIRNIDDVKFNNPRCQEQGLSVSCELESVHYKDFEDNDLYSGGWTQQVVLGSTEWGTASFGGNVWSRISNYNGGSNSPSDAWMISPAFDLTDLSNPSLSFLTTTNYGGPNLEVYVSTDFGQSMDVETATWNQIQADLAPIDGGWQDTPSGTIDLADYVSSATYVAFRYTGTASDGATWEVDNIRIFED